MLLIIIQLLSITQLLHGNAFLTKLKIHYKDKVIPHQRVKIINNLLI